MEIKFLIAIILITATANVTIGAGLGMPVEAKSAYDSGFDHGCSDSHISNPNNWYINGVNKNGESTDKNHHTAAFNAGYDAGFKECGYDNGVLIENTNERVNTQNQAAETNQAVSCHVLIGDCNTGQNSSNEFAAANDQ